VVPPRPGDPVIEGRPVEPITVRSTHVYRREDDDWKIVHRHGDNHLQIQPNRL
jgi:ketosteroid isomerase-like protein